MARICVVCVPLPGHVNPHVALGAGLRARGHDVVVYQLEHYRETIEKAGLTFVELSDDGERLNDFLRSFSTHSGLRAFLHIMHAAREYATTVLQRLPELLAKHKPDLVLVDQSDLFAHAVLQTIGVSFVTVCAALPIYREADVPPPVTSWRYKRGLWPRLRNRMGYAVWDALLLPLRWSINKARKNRGLKPIVVSEECFSSLAQIIPLPRALDFPRTQLPSSAVYTGPFLHLPAAELPKPLAWRSRFPADRPLVYASLGTLTNDDARFYRTLASACDSLGASLIIGLGGNAEAAKKLQDLPGNPLVLVFAPQTEILRECDAFVSHGGVNSVVEAGLASVPLVIVPYANDQPAMAARVECTGCCVVLPLSKVSALRLRSCLEAVLKEPRFRAAAAQLRVQLQTSGGLQAAVHVVEKALSKSRSEYWSLVN